MDSVEIKYKNENLIFELVPLEWAQTKKIRRKSVLIQEYKGEPMQFRDTDLMGDLRIIYSISSIKKKDGSDYSFEKSVEWLGKFSESNRDKLLAAVNKIRNVSED